MKYLLAFLFILSSANALATSYKVLSKKEFAVVQTLLQDNTVEFSSCSYNNVGNVDVGIRLELENCTPQLTDMNLKIQDFTFSENVITIELLSGLLALVTTGGLLTSAGLVGSGIFPIATVALPLVIFASGTVALVFVGAIAGGVERERRRIKKSIQRENLTFEKPLIFVFETEKDREVFLSDVRSAVERVRNPYRHQPLQANTYP